MKINPGSNPRPGLTGAVAKDKPAPSADNQKLRETCQEFEAIFVQTLLKGMRSTLPGDSLTEDGFSSDIYQDLKDMHVARGMAKSQGIGIAEALYRQLSALEEQKGAPPDESSK